MRMTLHRFIAFSGLACALLATPAQAAENPPEALPPVVQQVIDCRALPDPQARLACYDAKVDALAQANTRQDIYVADRESIRRTRRGLFGFSLPRLGIFGGGEDDASGTAVDSIEATIQSVGQRQSGYVFTLEDGAVWVQTDNRYIDPPRAGMTIAIRKATLGSYLANVDGGYAIRVRRENR